MEDVGIGGARVSYKREGMRWNGAEGGAFGDGARGTMLAVLT
jgi:hypothetical protein